MLKKDPPNPLEGLEEWTHDLCKILQDLQERLASPLLEDRLQALTALRTLKQTAQDESNRLAEKSNMTPAEIILFAETPQNFSPEEWRAIEAARTEFQKVDPQTANYKNVIKDPPQKGWIFG